MKTILDQHTVDLTANSEEGYTARLDDKAVDVKIVRTQDGRLDLLIAGNNVTAYVSSEGARRWVSVHGRTWLLTKSSAASRTAAARERASKLAAPMPGQVRSVNVKEGEAVTKGQTLLILEAMKMEIRIQAPRDGRVKSLQVRQGQTVERGKVLIDIEEAA